MRLFALALLATLLLRAQAPQPPALGEDEQAADLRDQDRILELLTKPFNVDEIYLDPAARDEVAANVAGLVAAAQQRVAREDALLQRAMALVDAGRAPAGILTPIQIEMTRRLETVTLARERASLIQQILDDASNIWSRPGLSRSSIMERYPGNGRYSPQFINLVSTAFVRQFHRPLPVSAHGMTATHLAMGLDHTGRYDVAVHPDQAEGVWLRRYLQSRGIPYFAFRRAVLGSATAPHIHIGPGSVRIHRAAIGTHLSTRSAP